MHVDECGAPERLAGIKLLTVPTDRRQADPGRRRAAGRRARRRAPVQPRVVSITQATELGTVYTPEETGAVAAAAHELGMFLHVDGAAPRQRRRIAGCCRCARSPPSRSRRRSPSAARRTALLLGDAVVFLRPELAETFRFTRKQLGQLASKMRFLAVQFDALLREDLWRANAAHANGMARRLAEAVSKLDGVRVAHPVEANGVFVTLPAPSIDRLRDALPASLPFYVWDEDAGTIRLMCSWDTTEEDVDELATSLAEALSRGPRQPRDPAPRL